MIREIITLMRSRMVRDRRGTIATMVGLTAIPMVLIRWLGT